MKSPIHLLKDLTFRKKIMLCFLLVSIIPVAILGLFCYQQTKALLVSQEEANLQSSLQQAADSLDNQIQIYNNLSDYLAFDSDLNESANRIYTNYMELYDAYSKTISPLFLSMKNLHDDVERITLYSGTNMEKHGNMVIPLQDAEGEIWYEPSIQSSKINWFVPAEDIVCAVRRMPEPDSGGTAKNLLYIEIDSQKLFSSFLELSENSCGIYLVDSNGSAVYSEIFAGLDVSEVPPLETLLDSDSSSITWNSSDYTVIQANIPSCGWDVYLYKPIHLITDAATPIVLTVAFIIMLCLILVVLIGWLLSHAVVSRIEKLQKTMQQVEGGDMGVTITSESHDEVGDLIRSFQKMLDKINALINEVYTGKLAQKEAEMRALQAQINPHFLYNSLSLINWRAIRADAPDISEMAQLLSTFYRTTLNKGKQLTSVADELKNTRSYIDIQRIMHSGQFEAIYQIEEGLGEYLMLNLLLQPLVENAIVHGLDQRPDGGGILRITAAHKKDTIVFMVEDNGVGIDPQALPNLLTQDSGGYGIKNVHERIQLYYGKEFGLTLESKLSVGTRATLTIPARRKNFESQLNQ